MKKLISLGILIFIIASSCQEIDDEGTTIQEGEPIALDSTQPTEFSIFEIATLDLGEGNFADGQQEGTTLDGVKIPLIIQDNTLIFMVPKLNQGEYKLVFKENNKPFNIPFKVKPHDLKESPETMLANYQQESQDQLDAINSFVNQLESSEVENLRQDLLRIKTALEGELSTINQLSEENKIDVAFFFQSNSDLLVFDSQLLDQLEPFLLNGRMSNTAVINVEMQSETLIGVLLEIREKILAGMEEYKQVRNLPKTVGTYNPDRVLNGTAILRFIRFMTSLEQASSEVWIPYGEDLEIEGGPSLQFKSGVPQELQILRAYRTLYQDDATSSIQFVRDFVLGYRGLIQYWNDFKANYSTAGLSYEPQDLSNGTSFKSKKMRVYSDYLSIESTQNSFVSNSRINNDGRFFANFNTLTKETFGFNFTLAYTHSSFGTIEETIEAQMVYDFETFTDPRDGNVYKIIKIGDQTWFAENLKYKTSESFCYDNDPQNCVLGGRLYRWELSKTVCPIGWHLPSIDEWRTLSEFLGGSDFAGGYLKSIKRWAEPNVGATNSTGFSAFAAGFLELDGSFISTQGKQAFFWSSTEMDLNSAFLIRFFNNSTRMVTNGGSSKDVAACIRCIKD
ncbi:hypothetical protein Aoki45_12340 [Algoriphagus sp. oki45]|uniref:fibrobacter succinogenes major paralogous domain-containing protein n=1 Tax=Algoriphagus sp. oki45 TaxID=3067294 RepID=UPI0027EA6457|nr:hypothetical protein Aoki45_12340 [Algoriphagus sp. oki45]